MRQGGKWTVVLLAFAVGMTGLAEARPAWGPWLEAAAQGRKIEEVAARDATVSLFSNGNIYAVDNQPYRPTVFALSRAVRIARITTYHWNYGAGTRRPGTIALLSDAGQWYGPWRASGEPGQGGVPNANWVVTLNQPLPPGTYRVIDSDPATWSQNEGSGGAGFAAVDAFRR
jgi:hypothetical protein